MSAKLIKLTFLAMWFTLIVGCSSERKNDFSFKLDTRLTDGTSQAIERLIQESLKNKYEGTELKDGYRVYTKKSGSSEWIFYQVYNAPKGLGAFNLYCYQRQKDGTLLLKAYVPVYNIDFPNSPETTLRIDNDECALKVYYRTLPIFSATHAQSSQQPESPSL